MVISFTYACYDTEFQWEIKSGFRFDMKKKKEIRK